MPGLNQSLSSRLQEMCLVGLDKTVQHSTIVLSLFDTTCAWAVPVLFPLNPAPQSVSAMPHLVIAVHQSRLGALSYVGARLLSLAMVYVNKGSNTRTAIDHDLEVVDISNDHEEESETCADVRAPGELVPHHGSLTFTNLFPLENTGPGFSTTYRRKET